jgi:hypothetical protein
MTTLELFTGEGETLGDRMRAAVQAEGLEALVKDAKAHVRTALQDAVDAESERTGTSFTSKLDGWSAQMTDPDPKPQVTDRQAFGDWARLSTSLPIEVSDRVVVLDHEAAMELIELIVTRGGNRQTLADLAGTSLGIEEDYLLPADPITPLIDSDRCRIIATNDDGWILVDTKTGEKVPGVTVTRARPTLRLVPKGKAQRAKAKRDVAELLGVPAEIARGDQ